jgi:hypothetical protein
MRMDTVVVLVVVLVQQRAEPEVTDAFRVSGLGGARK